MLRPMTPQQALAEIVRDHGAPEIVSLPRFVRDLLLERCPDPRHDAEVQLLILAIEAGVPRQLELMSHGARTETAITKLAGMIENAHRTSPQHARWAVEAWALALGTAHGATPELDTPATLTKILSGAKSSVPVPMPGGNLLIVDASGSGQFRSIGSALLRATHLDVIAVHPGTYKESVTITGDMHIVGVGGRSNVVVESASGQDAFTFKGGRSTLGGLTIRALGSVPAENAINVMDGTPVIEDCELTSYSFVVYVTGTTAHPTIRNCMIRGGNASGVLISGQGRGTIEECIIIENNYAGIAVSEQAFAFVHACEIRDNRGCGIFAYEKGSGTIEHCLIRGNSSAGVRIISEGNLAVSKCEISNNGGAGISVFDQGQGTFSANTLAANAEGAWDIRSSAGAVALNGNNPNW